MTSLFQTLTVLSAVLAWHFVIRYTTGSDWRATQEGRALVYFATALAGLLTVVSLSYAFGDYPGRDIVRFVFYTPIPLTLAWLNVVLIKAQRKRNEEDA